VDRGVSWLDTGHSYKNGQSEVEIGRLLRGRSEKPYVGTKLRVVPLDTMRSQIDTSLRRLQMDTVDCLMIHDVRSRADVLNESNMELLDETRRAGKVRFLGFSTHRNMAECLDAAAESGFYDVVLTSFNITVGQPPLVEAVARAHAAGIGVIAMKTQLGNFPDPGGGLTPHQASLKWVLEHEGISCAVPAMRDFRELEQNLAVMGQRLSYRDGRALEDYAVATASLRCSDCGGCEAACPHGVDVRDVRRCAMYLEGYKDPALARESYSRIASNAASCRDCVECAIRCSAGTRLQPLLSRTHAVLT
jgi:predicted aldo/keto reductase-like oxidoreductase